MPRLRILALFTLAILVLTAILIVPSAAAQPAVPQFWTVNSVADTDDGSCDALGTGTGNQDCTLREAIHLDQGLFGINNIQFAIPGSGVHVIKPATPLPAITGTVFIDGYTQTGSSANTDSRGDNAVITIELDGSLTSGAAGLSNQSNDLFGVSGLAINNFGIGIQMASHGDITGNFLGLDATGTVSKPNNAAITVSPQATDTEIGGTTPAARNLIANSTNDGIRISPGTGNSPKHVRISNNLIWHSGEIGIDLNANGVTKNDKADTDKGANTLQNFPALKSADSTSHRLIGKIRTKPNLKLTLEFFSSPACNPSGYGEGQFYLGTTTVTTDSTGLAHFNFIAPNSFAPGDQISATASTQTGNTSEFSKCKHAG